MGRWQNIYSHSQAILYNTRCPRSRTRFRANFPETYSRGCAVKCRCTAPWCFGSVCVNKIKSEQHLFNGNIFIEIWRRDCIPTSWNGPLCLFAYSSFNGSMMRELAWKYSRYKHQFLCTFCKHNKVDESRWWRAMLPHLAYSICPGANQPSLAILPNHKLFFLIFVCHVWGAVLMQGREAPKDCLMASHPGRVWPLLSPYLLPDQCVCWKQQLDDGQEWSVYTMSCTTTKWT